MSESTGKGRRKASRKGQPRRPLNERSVLPREGVDSALDAIGVNRDEFYERLGALTLNRARTQVPAHLMAAYAQFVEDGDVAAFIDAAGIKKEQVNQALGRCALQTVRDRRAAALAPVAALDYDTVTDDGDADGEDSAILSAI